MEESIRQALGPRWGTISVKAAGEVASTNLLLKARAREGAAPPFLLTADSQTAGRGRLGRQFVSPPGTGLYMSLFFSLPPWDPGLTAILAAVAACRAIEELTDARPKIKWVNDLFFRGKKICGILAERIDEGIILGVGVNLRTPPGGFPPEAGPAGALDRDVDRGTLAGTIARHVLEGAGGPWDAAVLEAYRARMPLVGKDIRYVQCGQEKNARVTGVSADGGLMILGPEGSGVLRAGEVSLGSQSLAGLL